ncbi:calcium/sodium antiporter [Psychrobacter aestuarii]|uniref:Calcium/sodium antiporter n=1 Tax=Psychrobacter aestuarii TaxID=556327 RepID=A0ABP3FA13_9GAMM|nr:calcium/sodium antiporter [Psychrobacter aestuarii]
MGLAVIAIVAGLAVLVWSADKFIDGATVIAQKFNVPSFLIGVLILGLGTSAPELVVSALAALDGSPELALGNAYGSNIMNIALVLGLTVLISPVLIERGVIKRDLPLLLLVTGVAAWQLYDGVVTLVDGMVLVAMLIGVLGMQIVLGKREQAAALHAGETDSMAQTDELSAEQMKSSTFSLIIGLVLLVISSRAVVWGAIELATLWGLSELIIGLTIVAIGTSLPELVASITAARRGEHGMALGNIVGSNIFNTLGVVGLAAVIAPISVSSAMFSRDVLVMAGLTLLLLALCVGAVMSKRRFGRLSGSTLVLCFLGYTTWLIESVSL